MKRCTLCNIEQEETEFALKNKKTGLRNSYCRACQNIRSKAHYQANKERYFARNRRKELRVRDIVIEAKSKPCVDCGGEFPFYVMTFDHVKGEKLFDLATARRVGTLCKVLVELEKCEVVCANCHAVRTYTRSHAPVA